VNQAPNGGPAEAELPGQFRARMKAAVGKQGEQLRLGWGKPHGGEGRRLISADRDLGRSLQT